MKKRIINCSISLSISENEYLLAEFYERVNEFACSLVRGGIVEWINDHPKDKNYNPFVKMFNVFYESSDAMNSNGPLLAPTFKAMDRKGEKERWELEAARKTISAQSKQITQLQRVIIAMQGNPDGKAQQKFDETFRAIIQSSLFDPPSK